MTAFEKVAVLLQQLPELRRMAEEQEAKRQAEALQARREAISTYRQAAKEQESARERLTKAEAKLEALRDKLLAEQENLNRAHEEATRASSRFSAAARELLLLHGEGDVERARYRLQLMHQDTKTRIAGLGDNLIEVRAGGIFRRERPEIRAKLTEAQAQLQKIEAAQQEITGLQLTEELTPDDLAERVAAILRRVAPPAPKPGTQAED